jgi:hypothetical protein
MRSVLVGLVALLTAPIVSYPALAQADREREVLAVVQRLFDGMRARDSAIVRSVFHPEARFASVAVRGDTTRVVIEPVHGFVAAVGRGGEPWDERLTSTEVRVDDTIASVWAAYDFYAGERFHHCGVDSIELLRTDAGWKITQLADTRRRDGCPGHTEEAGAGGTRGSR